MEIECYHGMVHHREQIICYRVINDNGVNRVREINTRQTRTEIIKNENTNMNTPPINTFNFFVFILVMTMITLPLLADIFPDYFRKIKDNKKYKPLLGKRVKTNLGYYTEKMGKGTITKINLWSSGGLYNVEVLLDNGRTVEKDLDDLTFLKQTKLIKQEPVKQTAKKKGLKMPRILRFVSWSLVVALLWKFVANIETIAPYIINLLTNK